MTNGEANTPITSGVMRTISVPVVGIADSSNVTGPEAPCTKILRTEPTAEMLGAIETASETPSGRVVVNAEADEIRLTSAANTLTRRKNLLLLLNIMVIIQHNKFMVSSTLGLSTAHASKGRKPPVINALPAAHSNKVLEQARERLRHLQYSIRTEGLSLLAPLPSRWSGVWQPAHMGANAVRAFLTYSRLNEIGRAHV